MRFLHLACALTSMLFILALCLRRCTALRFNGGVHYAVTIAFLTLFSEADMVVFWGCIAASVVFSWLIALLTEPVTKRLRERVRGFALR